MSSVHATASGRISTASVTPAAVGRDRGSYPKKKMDHRELLFALPVMNEVQFLFPSEPCNR